MEEYEVKFNKRIKVEHSYARDGFTYCEVRDEDPLKIYPEDIDGIKKETEEEETIIIKSEPPEDYHYPNTQNQNEHCEKSLMEVVSSEPCESAENNYFLTCTLPTNCEIEVENNTASVEPVPRHVFQEVQRMYECAMDDVKSLNKKLATVKSKRDSRSSKSANNIRTLKSDIKKLKDQLNSAKMQEQLTKRMLDLKCQEEAEQKKTNNTLKGQLESLVKLSKDRHAIVMDLKQQIEKRDDSIRSLKSTLKQQTKLNQKRKDTEDNVKKLKEQNALKDTQYKELDLRCALLTQKLATTNAKFALQKKELEKLKLDIDIMDKSIIDSVKTRQSLKEQATDMEKDLRELKENPVLSLKLQETQKALNQANRRVEEVHKKLLAEKKAVSKMMIEKSQLTKEHATKLKELDMHNGLLQHTVAALKKAVNQKTEQCRMLSQECETVRQVVEKKERQVERMGAEIKEKEKEFQTRQCEYCGF